MESFEFLKKISAPPSAAPDPKVAPDPEITVGPKSPEEFEKNCVILTNQINSDIDDAGFDVPTVGDLIRKPFNDQMERLKEVAQVEALRESLKGITFSPTSTDYDRALNLIQTIDKKLSDFQAQNPNGRRELDPSLTIQPATTPSGVGVTPEAGAETARAELKGSFEKLSEIIEKQGGKLALSEDNRVLTLTSANGTTLEYNARPSGPTLLDKIMHRERNEDLVEDRRYIQKLTLALDDISGGSRSGAALLQSVMGDPKVRLGSPNNSEGIKEAFTGTIKAARAEAAGTNAALSENIPESRLEISAKGSGSKAQDIQNAWRGSFCIELSLKMEDKNALSRATIIANPSNPAGGMIRFHSKSGAFVEAQIPGELDQAKAQELLHDRLTGFLKAKGDIRNLAQTSVWDAIFADKWRGKGTTTDMRIGHSSDAEKSMLTLGPRSGGQPLFSGHDISRSSIDSIIFDECSLSGVIAEGIVVRDSIFIGVKADQAILVGSQFHRCDLDLELTGGSVERVDLHDSKVPVGARLILTGCQREGLVSDMSRSIAELHASISMPGKAGTINRIREGFASDKMSDVKGLLQIRANSEYRRLYPGGITWSTGDGTDQNLGLRKYDLIKACSLVFGGGAVTSGGGTASSGSSPAKAKDYGPGKSGGISVEDPV